MYAKALRWPIITTAIVLAAVTAVGLVYRDVLPTLTDEAFAPLLAAVGIWVGYKMVQFGGNYGHGLVGGLAVGAVCGILDILLFGVVLGFGVAAALPSGVFALLFNTAGALIGAGFALSR